MLSRLAILGKVRVDRGANGAEGEAGQGRRGHIHCQAVAQGQKGQVVLQEPGTDGSCEIMNPSDHTGCVQLEEGYYVLTSVL